MRQRKIKRENEIFKLTEEIKDEIDRLHEISSRKRRLEAARDLIEYLQLHHVEYPS